MRESKIFATSKIEIQKIIGKVQNILNMNGTISDFELVFYRLSRLMFVDLVLYTMHEKCSSDRVLWVPFSPPFFYSKDKLYFMKSLGCVIDFL